MISSISGQNNVHILTVNNNKIKNDKDDVNVMLDKKDQSQKDIFAKFEKAAGRKTIFLGDIYDSEGYIDEFDKVSREYRDKMCAVEENARYEIKGNLHRRRCDFHFAYIISPTETINAMEEKYQELKKGILENYTGEEQKKQLSALDKEFKIVMDKNVVRPIEDTINNNKAEFFLLEFFSKISDSKSHFGNITKGDIERFKSEIDKIKKQFEELKKSLEQIHEKEGVLDYIAKIGDMMALSSKNLAKSFNAKFKKVDEKAIEKLEEFGKLSKEKEKLLKYKDKGKTDEEKYQSAAKNKKELEKIDKRIKSFVEYELKID